MSATSTTKAPCHILYVDDDNDDFLFLSESLAAEGAATDLVCASGGEEAIQYLHSTDNLPSLIVMDLNMPRWDGKRTLAYLKSNSSFANIPVVILSTSERKEDKEACVSLGASSYLIKPYHFDGYKNVVRSFIPLLGAC
jgi:CheY-like chemotaxis protein